MRFNAGARPIHLEWDGHQVDGEEGPTVSDQWYEPDLFEAFEPDPSNETASTAVSSPDADPAPEAAEPLPLRDLARLARDLMNEHGLNDWRLSWDRAVRRAGQTRFQKRTLSLSGPLMRLFPPAESRNTILHEIAHALAGPTAGHGDTWKAVAVEIGARPERCYDSNVARIEGDWRGVCPVGHSRSRHRAPKHLTVSCARCQPHTFDSQFLITWYWRGIPVLKPGTSVELIGDHQWTGRRGRIHRLKDTRYLVALDDGQSLNVPFPLVTVPGDDPAAESARRS